MNSRTWPVCVYAICLLPGCAHLDFGEQGLTYYETLPHLFVSTTPDCVPNATVVAIPGEKKFVKFKSGYGAAELTVSLSNGMIVSAGQTTDTKIPETITAVAGLGAAMARPMS